MQTHAHTHTHTNPVNVCSEIKVRIHKKERALRTICLLSKTVVVQIRLDYSKFFFSHSVLPLGSGGEGFWGFGSQGGQGMIFLRSRSSKSENYVKCNILTIQQGLIFQKWSTRIGNMEMNIIAPNFLGKWA